MRGGATSSNLATTSACNPARGGSTMTTRLGVMKSRAFSLGARMARALVRPRAVMLRCISATADSLISMSVTLSPLTVSPIVPTPA